jgi:hypothetical protein
MKNNQLSSGVKAFLFFFVAATSLNACKPSYEAFRSDYEKQASAKTDTAPDYRDLYYWAAHPEKKDPSDSTPKSLIQPRKALLADVFFIHPTTLTNPKLKSKVWNAPLNDADLNLKTDFTSVLYQASVFNGSCRVFAPRYRQAHIHAFNSSDTLRAIQAFELAYTDIRNAFQYYLQHENNGRPIILASHSQGTLHARWLIKDFFDGKPLQQKLVCAYLLGLELPAEAFSQMGPCLNDSSTGCLIGWRTYRKNYIPSYILNEKRESIVVNPLSWNTDTLRVSRRQNEAAVLFQFNRPYKHTNGAQIHSNVLWIEKPRFPFSFIDRRKNYHPGDINLFYLNIRNNVKRRVDVWSAQYPGSED